MTKQFNVKYTCEHCGKQSTQESAFGRWMRNNPKFGSTIPGIVQSDLDFVILRHTTTRWNRDFQLMQTVEVKEHGTEPDICKKDILHFFRQLVRVTRKNMHDATTDTTIRAYSKKNRRDVLLRFLGVHLLQFQNTGPDDSDWISWDNKRVTLQTLEELIVMDRHPYYIDRMMDEFLRDRHRKDRNLLLPFKAA